VSDISTRVDEQQIRALSARIDATASRTESWTKDRIFWSVAQRPEIGVEQPQAEEIPNERRPSLRVPGSPRVKTTIVRIEVAKSGDLAYEFDNQELSVQTKNGKSWAIPLSQLRVWKKEAGESKLAVEFSNHHSEVAKP
jgi:hypothetical protein